MSKPSIEPISPGISDIGSSMPVIQNYVLNIDSSQPSSVNTPKVANQIVKVGAVGQIGKIVRQGGPKKPDRAKAGTIVKVDDQNQQNRIDSGAINTQTNFNEPNNTPITQTLENTQNQS